MASHLHGIFVPHLKVYIQSPGTVQALSYLITFLGTMIALYFLVRFLKGVLKIAMLTMVDKVAGAAFGCLEGLLFSLVILLLMKAVMPGTSLIRESVMAKHTDPALVLLANFTPTPVRQTLEEGGFALPKPLEMPPAKPKPTPPQQAPGKKGRQTI
jgi:membrane protein required for colicin V production